VIEFFIPHELKPKGNRKQAWKGASFPTHPKSVKDNAAALRYFAAEHRPDTPWSCGVKLVADVVYPWRSNTPNRVKELGMYPKFTRPDVDNLLKQLGDVLQSTGFFTDDGKIAEATIRKWHGAHPGINVQLTEWCGETWGEQTREAV
jgi:Holliday junction resolvase RusA-like endonuclease